MYVWSRYPRLDTSHQSIIRDGNPGIGAHVRSNLCYLICRSGAVSNQIFFLWKDLFFFMRAQHLPSIIRTIPFTGTNITKSDTKKIASVIKIDPILIFDKQPSSPRFTKIVGCFWMILLFRFLIHNFNTLAYDIYNINIKRYTQITVQICGNFWGTQ